MNDSFNKKILARPEGGICGGALNRTPHKKFRPIRQNLILSTLHIVTLFWLSAVGRSFIWENHKRCFMDGHKLRHDDYSILGRRLQRERYFIV